MANTLDCGCYFNDGKRTWCPSCLDPTPPKRDACERCKGGRGGVPGNENVIDDRVLCDYCHVDIMREAEVAELRGDAVWMFRLIDKEAFHGPECTCSEDDMPCPVNVYYDMKERWRKRGLLEE